MTYDTPCPTFDWCDGHDDRPDDNPDYHCTKMPPVTAGDSTVSVDVDMHPDEGLVFEVQLDYWKIDARDVDQEFRDLRSIVDQIETQVRDFLFNLQISAREPAHAGTLRMILGSGQHSTTPVFIEPTGGDAA